MKTTVTQITKKESELKEVSFHWASKESVGRWEKAVAITVVVLTLLFVAVVLWHFLKHQIVPSVFYAVFTLPFYFALARLFDLWPHTAGNFVYFRDGKILYRVGYSSLNLKQGTVTISELQSVFIQEGSLIMKTDEQLFSFSTGAIPKGLLPEIKKRLLSEVKLYDYIKVTRIAKLS